MAINPKIKQKAEDIRKKIFGSEVRESLASGIEAISEDVEATIGRQDYVEEQFQNVIDETTDKDVISAPELIAARNGKSNLKTRLDEEHAQVTAQLQQTEQELSSQLADKANLTDVSSPYNFKGSTTFALLPATNNAVNDTYYVTDYKSKYSWNGSAWYQSSLDESAYQTSLNAKLADIDGVYKNIVGRKQVNGIIRTLEDSTTALANTTILYANHDIKVSVASGYRYLIFTWVNASAFNATNFIASSGWKTDEQTILKGTYYAIQFGAVGGTTIDMTAIGNIKLTDVVTYEKLTTIESNISALQATVNTKETLYHILGTGQSLSVGSEGNPSLTTLCPMDKIGKAFMFNGGARPWDSTYDYLLSKTAADVGLHEEISVDNSSMAYFTPLHEKDISMKLSNGDGTFRYPVVGETTSSGLGYNFTTVSGKKCVVSQHGFGGKDYLSLKKGTIAYNNALRSVAQAKYIAESMGYKYEVLGVSVVHGEADSQGTGETTYKGYLLQWQADFDADIKAISGQTNAVKLFVSQTASASSYGFTSSPIPNAVFLASLENSNIKLVCPQYWFTYKSVHMDNAGYRRLGEYYGHKMGRSLNGGLNDAVYPISSVSSATTITLSFNYVAGLTLDTTNVLQRSDGNYGFNISDDGGAVITNVALTNNQIVLTLDKAPNPTATVSYAYKPLADEMGKIGALGVRGNLRDTGGFNSYFDGTSHPNWCAIFSVPINWTA